jgi:hypothetical protein
MRDIGMRKICVQKSSVCLSCVLTAGRIPDYICQKIVGFIEVEKPDNEVLCTLARGYHSDKSR